MTEDRRTKRRGARWVGGALLLAMLLGAGVLGLQFYRLNNSIQLLRNSGAHIAYGVKYPWLTGIESITGAPKPYVHEIHAVALRWQPLNDEQLIVLVQAMQPFESIKELNLAGTGITDKGAAALATLPQLEILSIAKTRVTNTGLESIARLPKLRYLTLSGTQITDAGLPALTSLSNLEVLSLDQTNVSDAGIETLAALPKLRELSVSNTQVTDAGLGVIEKQRPGLVVSDD